MNTSLFLDHLDPQSTIIGPLHTFVSPACIPTGNSLWSFSVSLHSFITYPSPLFTRSHSLYLFWTYQAHLATVRGIHCNYGTKFKYDYGPEIFTQTEPDFTLEICEAVRATWGRAGTGKDCIILNLPSMVKIAPPNHYADQIKYFALIFLKERSPQWSRYRNSIGWTWDAQRRAAYWRLSVWQWWAYGKCSSHQPRVEPLYARYSPQSWL